MRIQIKFADWSWTIFGFLPEFLSAEFNPPLSLFCYPFALSLLLPYIFSAIWRLQRGCYWEEIVTMLLHLRSQESVFPSFCLCVKHSPAEYRCWRMKWSKLKSLTDHQIYMNEICIRKYTVKIPYSHSISVSYRKFPLIFPLLPHAYRMIIMGRINCTFTSTLRDVNKKETPNMYKWRIHLPL